MLDGTGVGLADGDRGGDAVAGAAVDADGSTAVPVAPGLPTTTAGADATGDGVATAAISIPPRDATKPIDSTKAPMTAMAEAAIAGETDGPVRTVAATGRAAAPRR